MTVHSDRASGPSLPWQRTRARQLSNYRMRPTRLAISFLGGHTTGRRHARLRERASACNLWTALGGIVAQPVRGDMDTDRVIQLLEEIRDLQRELVASYQQALRNQAEAVRAQRDAIARGRKLQAALGIVIAVVLVIVVLLLRYVLRRYA